MMRPSTSSPAFDRSRQCAVAWRVAQKWPFRWTATTASHSASDIEKIIRSRRMPALFTRTSRRPNVSTASATSCPAASKSVMSAPLTMASPPFASISATTSFAGPEVGAGAVRAAAEVVHHDLGPLRRQHQRVLTPDAAPRPGHDRHPSSAQSCHRPLSLRPGARPSGHASF